MASEQPAKSNRQQQIGKFRIVARIATGGMGAVYKAWDTERDYAVALKILSPDMAAKPRMIDRFRQEALYGAKLHHPNVVTLYESGEINGIHYLALEFVEGIDLQAYILQKGQVDVDESRQIIIQATRAIAHLHQKGVIHRDIKPSNFLIRHLDGQPRIKLIDLGLARHRDDDEECRMTRAGATVGTVDYISPEQARNSGAADVRSDIYSLGCTWYHLLTGQPPFTEGSLVERLYKHVEEEPPDVRKLNPEVPATVVQILKRMMAKEPSERYQTPAALLRDLEGSDSVVQPFSKSLLARLAQDHDQEPLPVQRPVRTRSVSRPRGPKAPGGGRRLVSVAWAVALILGLAAFTLAGMLIARVLSGSSTPTTDTAGEKTSEQARTPVAPLPLPQPTQPGPKPLPTTKSPTPVAPKVEPSPAPPPALRKLYEPRVPIRVDALNDEFNQPWEKVPAPLAGPTLRVAHRLRGDGVQTFSSLAAACAAAPADRETVIEIDANGPLFEGPITVSGRSLVLRAGKGFRPLLAWDAPAPGAGKGEQFFTVANGRLTLENLEVVCQTSAKGQTDTAALFRVTDGDLTAKGCTFSVAGTHSVGVAVVRLEGTGTVHRCRLRECIVRGAEVTAVDLRVTGAEVLLDGCLVVGVHRPLVDVRGPHPVPPSTVRVRRSTLVAGRSVVRLAPATPTGLSPALRFLGWDALLARSGSQPEGGLLVVEERADPGQVQWQATNCLYAGWRTLLKAPGKTITDLDAWRTQWHQVEGDALVGRTWPALAHDQPGEVPTSEYRTVGSDVAFAATTGPGPLGCDLEALPPTRDTWRHLTYDPFPPSQAELSRSGTVPPVPAAADGRYHGERLDLGQIGDLGQYVANLQRSRELGPRVVLHLAGTGEHPTSPIVWQKGTLVLCFEAPAEDAEPLVLVPNGVTGPDREALIEAVDGGLELVGATIRCRDRKLLPLPAYLLHVRGGDLSLRACWLEGPLTQPPDQFRGLIHFEGTGKTAGHLPGCAVADSVLVSAKTLVRVAKRGARVRLENCVLLANGDALEFDPGATDQPRLEMHGVLRRNTVAVNGAVLHLKDAPTVPDQPILFQATANVFTDPFTDPTARAGLLRYAGSALDRGLLHWQGRGNLYDKRFRYYALAEEEPLPDKPQPYALWARLWGAAGDKEPVADAGLSHPLTLGKPPSLGQLALPFGFPKSGLGADLNGLGLVKKKRKK